MFCKADTGPCIPELLFVPPVRDPGIITVTAGNSTFDSVLPASIAYVRGTLQMTAVFTLKVRTGLIAGRT